MELIRLHHVRVQSTDLEATERFASDFGLRSVSHDPDRLLMRTPGGDRFCYIVTRAERPGFIGFGFEARSEADLDEAVRKHDAAAPQKLDTPDGGNTVRLTDPDGVQIEIVSGVRRDRHLQSPPELELNTPGSRKRFGAAQHRRDLGAPQLFRLGHIGLFVRSFARSSEWYERTLGLIPSDVYHVPGDPSVQIAGFLRLNRGQEWVDHHVLALFQRERPDLHHVSFEAQDFETQFMAHRWLQSRGHEPIWGVGRHPHGSHVFDVWRDPNGYRFETFSDTDLLTASRPTAVHDISESTLDVWRSDPPDRYFA